MEGIQRASDELAGRLLAPHDYVIPLKVMHARASVANQVDLAAVLERAIQEIEVISPEPQGAQATPDSTGGNYPHDWDWGRPGDRIGPDSGER